MRIKRETTATVKLTELELCEALGLDGEGNLCEVTVDYDPSYHRMGSGANVVSLTFRRLTFKRRKPRPRRVRRRA